MGKSPSLEERPYRRGLVLGLTMAEIVMLLLFALLLAWMAGIEQEAERTENIDELEHRVVELEEQRNFLLNSGTDVNKFDEIFLELRLARAELGGGGSGPKTQPSRATSVASYFDYMVAFEKKSVTSSLAAPGGRSGESGLRCTHCNLCSTKNPILTSACRSIGSRSRTRSAVILTGRPDRRNTRQATPAHTYPLKPIRVRTKAGELFLDARASRCYGNEDTGRLHHHPVGGTVWTSRFGRKVEEHGYQPASHTMPHKPRGSEMPGGNTDRQYIAEFPQLDPAQQNAWSVPFFNTIEYLCFVVNHTGMKNRMLKRFFFEEALPEWQKLPDKHSREGILRDALGMFPEFKKSCQENRIGPASSVDNH